MALTTQFDTRFRTLIEQWNHHQMLRSNGASVRELATSRARLDAARLDAYRTV